MSKVLGCLNGNTEEVSPEFLDDESPELLMLPCRCKVCGFTTTLTYTEKEKEAIGDIAQSMHERDFPNCLEKLFF